MAIQISGTDVIGNSKQFFEVKGADVASATSLILGADGNYFDITGTTTITSIATLGVGTKVALHFDAAVTLTHDATNLILPGAANYTTAAGDELTFIEYASGDWRCVSYALANGQSIIDQATSTKAWVNFNGTGTVAINADDNVSSLTDNGVGRYTVNFSTSMTDANYTVSGCVGAGHLDLRDNPPVLKTINAVSVSVIISAGTLVDRADVSVSIIGN